MTSKRSISLRWQRSSKTPICQKVQRTAANLAREELQLNWVDDQRILVAHTKTPRLCARCGTPLPDNADSRRKYCPDNKCR